MKRYGTIFFICTLLAFFSTNVAALSYYEEGDVRYFVGMMYDDAWLHANGTWQNNKNPFGGSSVAPTQNYSFNFSERKIKNVTVEPYNGVPSEYIIQSRGERWKRYEERSSTNVQPQISNITGIGESEISFTVTANANLNALYPLEITDQATHPIHDNVEGYRTYLPVLIKIELEPVEQVVYDNDSYIFSAFNNYTITHYHPNTHDKRLYTFWMFRPIDAEPELEDEFLIQGTSWTYQDKEWPEREAFDTKYFQLSEDKPFMLYEFYSDVHPMDVVIWRKGKENETYKNDNRFKQNFWAGYTKQYQGETYYYYDHWNDRADGQMYPTKYLFKHFPEEVGNNFATKFGFYNAEIYDQHLRKP